MSKSVNWSINDIKKKGLIETDKGFVKASSLVAKPKDVEKLSSLKGYAESVIKAEQERSANPTKPHFHWEQEKATLIKIKPMSVNGAWAGKRFKTPQYKKYTEAVSLLLPNDLIVPEGLLRVYYEFGMSTNSDFDNPVKLITDILQKKYGFNDRNIMEASIKKVIVKKGQEYISFKLESL